jgi:hypothetical protein
MQQQLGGKAQRGVQQLHLTLLLLEGLVLLLLPMLLMGTPLVLSLHSFLHVLSCSLSPLPLAGWGATRSRCGATAGWRDQQGLQCHEGCPCRATRQQHLARAAQVVVVRGV